VLILAGFLDCPRHLTPLGPLPKRIHRARQVRKALRLGAAELGECRVGQPVHLLGGDGVHNERGTVDRCRGSVVEPHARGSMPHDLERPPVGDDARSAVDRPHDTRFDGLDR
jgi:hypothetical protein